MKKLYLLLILLSGWQLATAQTEAYKFEKLQLKNVELLLREFKGIFASTDFCSLFTKTDNADVYGFIGNDYQRIRIKFISVTKDPSLPYTYNVYGKSMVKSNTDEFRGTIKISTIRKFKTTSFGVDDELKNKGLKGQFMIVGDYNFSENKGNSHSGIFKGAFRSDFYLDKNNRYHYDDIEKYADGYTNNEFVGRWVSYDGKLVKRCNWGDFRIPNSGNFDIGAGEFSPGIHVENGWTTIHEMYSGNKKIQAKAKAIEEAKWWK